MNTIACSGQGTAQRIEPVYRAAYGMAPDGSDDFDDLDGDGYTAFQEWLANTHPRDNNSFFRVEAESTMTPDGFEVVWPGASNRTYRLLRSTNLADLPPFMPIAEGIEGVVPWTRHTDTNQAVGPLRIYRIEIETESESESGE